MSEEDRVATGAAASLVASVTALAGIAGRPDEAIAVAAISSALQPLFEEQLHWVLDVVRRFGRRRRITPAALEAELTASPAKQELLIRALDASRTASAEEKRRAIAASIAAGLESDLDAARENDILRVIADIDLAHALALRILSQPRTLMTNAAFLGHTSFEMRDLGTSRWTSSAYGDSFPAGSAVCGDSISGSDDREESPADGGTSRSCRRGH